MLLKRCLEQNWGSVKMPQSLSPIKQIAVWSFTRAGRLTGLNYDGGVRERHITSSLHFSWIHCWPEYDWEEAHTKKKTADSWQIAGVQDGELTDDRRRDWEEKVAENVKHADGYRRMLEWIADQKG